VDHATIPLSTKRKVTKMVAIEHTLKFVTEVDETNPTGARLLQLDKTSQVLMLESALREFVLPAIGPVLENINKGGSWAIVKVAE
jgi:hypothetical protein